MRPLRDLLATSPAAVADVVDRIAGGCAELAELVGAESARVALDAIVREAFDSAGAPPRWHGEHSPLFAERGLFRG